MEREELLKAMIKTRYRSVLEFSKDAEIPESSIRNIFSRGIDSVNAGTLVKICQKLNIDLESLMSGSLSVRPNPDKEAIWAHHVEEQNKKATIDVVDDDLREYLDELRTRPEMRMLFSTTKNATKAQIEAIVQFIEGMQEKK